MKIWQISASPSCLCTALFSIWRLMVEVVVERCIHAARRYILVATCVTPRDMSWRKPTKDTREIRSRVFPPIRKYSNEYMHWSYGEERAPLPRFRPRKPQKIPICHGSFSPTYRTKKKKKEKEYACVRYERARGKNQSTEEKGGQHTLFLSRERSFFWRSVMWGGEGRKYAELEFSDERPLFSPSSSKMQQPRFHENWKKKENWEKVKDWFTTHWRWGERDLSVIWPLRKQKNDFFSVKSCKKNL